MKLEETKEYIELCGNQDFIKYQFKKKGLFSVPKPNGEYKLLTGWENEIVEIEIIGETNELYVSRIKKCPMGIWNGHKVQEIIVDVEEGVHKSRLEKWTYGQLTIDDILKEVINNQP